MKLRFKDKINYILLCGVVYPLSLLPLRVLYLFADVTAWLARCVVHYRRGTVRRNIEEAFPDRDTKELRRIEKGFYHWLADYGVETLKLLTMSERTIRRRLVVENPELKAKLRGAATSPCSWVITATGNGCRHCLFISLRMRCARRCTIRCTTRRWTVCSSGYARISTPITSR